MVIAKTAGTQPGAWLTNGDLLFTPGVGGLFRVPATGGSPTAVTTLAKEELFHGWPKALPDGRHFVMSAVTGDVITLSGTAPEIPLFVGTIGSSERKRLGNFVPTTAFAPPGYLLFPRNGALMAQGLDVETLTLRGEPEVLVQDVSMSALVSVSNEGTLALRSAAAVGGRHRVVWFERGGTQAPLTDFPVGEYAEIELSPDGRRFALTSSQGSNTDILAKTPGSEAMNVTRSPQSTERAAAVVEGVLKEHHGVFLLARRRLSRSDKFSDDDAVAPARSQISWLRSLDRT